MSKKERIKVQRETIAYVEKHKAKFKSGVKKYLDCEPQLKRRDVTFETNIQTSPLDTLEAVIELQNENPYSKIGFLVFGNSTNPGGNYKEGTPAQEESVCRRTNLVSMFDRMKYPIPEHGSFYIKDLSIFRDLEKNHYEFLEKPITCDAVIAAAYHGPPMDQDKLIDGYREKTKLKIQYILNAFLDNNVIDIVLGAFGCGAFGNPVQDIANIFNEILNSDEYKGRFQNIVFAVLKEAGGENYRIFRETIFC